MDLNKNFVEKESQLLTVMTLDKPKNDPVVSEIKGMLYVLYICPLRSTFVCLQM